MIFNKSGEALQSKGDNNGAGILPKERRKAPCFSYGDIRRALSCVMWEFAV